MADIRMFLPDGSGIMGSIHDEGVLTFAVLARPDARIRGTEMFDLMMRVFGSRVRAIEGVWRQGFRRETSVNLDRVNELVAAGMSLEDAVCQTWTATRAARWGYRNVSLRSGPRNSWRIRQGRRSARERRDANMKSLEGGICAAAIQELRVRASHTADVPELVEYLVANLGLSNDRVLFPVLTHFQAAFCLSLRDVLPLREWLAGKDRSEVDSRLIPAMQRTRDQWQVRQLQSA